VIDWRELVSRADAAIDAQFGEDVRFLPWHRGEYDDGTPDTSRPTVDARAIMRLDLDTVGAGGGPVERVGQTFASRTVNEPVRLSVDGDAVRAADLRQGDRVHSLDPKRAGTVDEWFEIKWLGADAAGRVNVHLARLVSL
jgi:hypothetical protein